MFLRGVLAVLVSAVLIGCGSVPTKPKDVLLTKIVVSAPEEEGLWIIDIPQVSSDGVNWVTPEVQSYSLKRGMQYNGLFMGNIQSSALERLGNLYSAFGIVASFGSDYLVSGGDIASLKAAPDVASALTNLPDDPLKLIGSFSQIFESLRAIFQGQRSLPLGPGDLATFVIAAQASVSRVQVSYSQLNWVGIRTQTVTYTVPQQNCLQVNPPITFSDWLKQPNPVFGSLFDFVAGPPDDLSRKWSLLNLDLDPANMNNLICYIDPALSTLRHRYATTGFVRNVRSRDASTATIELPKGDPAGSPNGTVVAKSDFSSGLDGWTCQGDGSWSWSGSGGNPGGYLQSTDPAAGTNTDAVAPSKFLGSWANIENCGALSFDLLRVYSNPSPPDAPLEQVSVIIQGGGGQAKALLGTPPSINTWTTYRVPIQQNVWTVTGTSWGELLVNVTGIRIDMEFVAGTEKNGVDNVILQYTISSSEVP